MLDRLFQRPPAGISTVERAKAGSPSAKATVVKAVVEEKPAAGLSLAELAKLGLESARKKIEVIYDAAGIKTEDL